MDTPTISMDDDAVMAAVAAGAAAASNLRHMQDFIAGAAGARDVAPEVLFEEEQQEEGSKPKQVRRAYPRPDYWGSAWGGWLRELKELSAGEDGLDPKCREAVQFKSTFRVKYELFQLIMKSVASIFPGAEKDVAGRDCPPAELKVGRIIIVSMFDGW